MMKLRSSFADAMAGGASAAARAEGERSEGDVSDQIRFQLGLPASSDLLGRPAATRTQAAQSGACKDQKRGDRSKGSLLHQTRLTQAAQCGACEGAHGAPCEVRCEKAMTL